MNKMRTKTKAQSFKHVRSRSKKGVSPVIGVILMVAATIVIAGVVMAMLGGFGPPKRAYLITATASEIANTSAPTTTDITVTCTGGSDISQLNTTANAFSITINGLAQTTASAGTLLTATQSYTGLSAVFHQGGTSGQNNDHIVVSADFKDGTTQVILDTYV